MATLADIGDALSHPVEHRPTEYYGDPAKDRIEARKRLLALAERLDELTS